MKTIKLNILAEDFKNSSYFDAQNCALTKAIQRANINAIHLGNVFEHNDLLQEIASPIDLDSRVRNMYTFINPGEMSRSNVPEKPEDFTYDLKIPDNWNIN